MMWGVIGAVGGLLIMAALWALGRKPKIDPDDVRPLVPSPQGLLEGPSTNMLRKARQEFRYDETLAEEGYRSVEERTKLVEQGEVLPPFEDPGADNIEVNGL